MTREFKQQSEFKWYAKKILRFERSLLKIRDTEKNCLLNSQWKVTTL